MLYLVQSSVMFVSHRISLVITVLKIGISRVNISCCIKSPFSGQSISFISCPKMDNSVFIFHALKQTVLFFLLPSFCASYDVDEQIKAKQGY